jgi:hypothetical protein
MTIQPKHHENDVMAEHIRVCMWVGVIMETGRVVMPDVE